MGMLMPFSIHLRNANSIWIMCVTERTVGVNFCNISIIFLRQTIELPTVQLNEASSMTAYQGIRIFSNVVLAMMAAGTAYAAYIAITYWTGISV